MGEMENFNKTVIIVSDTARINGGAGKVAINSAVGLAEKGIKVIFFAGGGKTDESLLNNQNITVCNLDMPDLLTGNKIKMFFNGVYNKKAKKGFDKLLSTLNLDNVVVHVHSWVKTLSPSIFDSLRKRNKEFFITTHDYFLICPNGGLLNYPKNQICKPIKEGFNCLRCNCDSRKYLYKIWRFVKFRKQSKILRKCKYKLITISDFLENVFKEKKLEGNLVKNPITLNTEGKPLLNENAGFGFIGRLSREKGIENFIKALIKSNKRGVIVGDGPESERLKDLCKGRDIEFKGWVKSEEIKNVYPEIKCLVFPSLWYEGAPLTIPEVQSFGIPCIVSDVCAGKDYIKDGENGYVYNGTSVDDLIEKMKLIDALSKEEFEVMRERTKEIALSENNDLNKHVNELIKVYVKKQGENQ